MKVGDMVRVKRINGQRTTLTDRNAIVTKFIPSTSAPFKDWTGWVDVVFLDNGDTLEGALKTNMEMVSASR